MNLLSGGILLVAISFLLYGIRRKRRFGVN
ncbi:hypothetical protein [Anaerobacillus sp. CMMVII]